MRRWGWIVACLGLWLIFESTISWMAFCDQGQEQEATYQAAEKYECIFRGPVILSARGFVPWWKHVFDKPDAYVALFTALLFISTVFLWNATRDAARASTAAAEALPNIERAYVFIDPDLERRELLGGANVGVFYSRYRVKLSIVNHGKTPAVIRSVDARLAALREPPDNSRHLIRDFSPDQILPSGGSYVPESSPYSCTVDEPTAIEIANNQAAVWFYGSVYYEDVFGKEHVTRFRWCWSEILDVFTARGDVPYNERT